MDGVLAAAVTAAVIAPSALLAWRWWLADKAETRKHELVMRQQVVQVEQKTLDGLAGRLSALESELKDLRWKKS